MAIKNQRKSITENSSENRLKAILHEGYNRFLKEGPEDDMLDMDEEMPEDDMDMDMPEGGDDLADDTDMDMGAGEPVETPMENLTDTEFEQVDSWIDELLGDSIEMADVNGGDALDVEADADSLDPMGEESYVHEDLPMTSDDMQSIIDSDDSLGALEDELAGLAQDDEMGEEMGEEMPTEDDDMLMGESFDFEQGKIKTEEDEEELDEAEDPFKGIADLPGFEQGYEGEDVKDELMEDVALVPGNKELGFEETAAGLNDNELNDKVTPMEGRTPEDIEKDQKGIVTESVKKSKMLYKAAMAIANQKAAIKEMKESINKLKLENYKLIKANGLLSVAGDVLTKEARTQISEAFDKCQSVDQVNKFYAKLTEKIRTAQKPSLNEVATSRKTKIQILKEAVNNPTKPADSYEQMRKNMLMGLNTETDMYFNM
jgi:hypothetical protein